MDLIIAERFQISHDLVWFSRQECVADMQQSALSPDGDVTTATKCRTTEELWNEVHVDLDRKRQGKTLLVYIKS